MSFAGAFIRALWTFAPAPAIHLMVAPLVMFAWRSRVRPRMTIRLDRSATPPLSRPAAPPLSTAAPNWDAVMHETAPFDRGPARIAETQQARHFVESLARRIVPRCSQQPIVTPLRDVEQQRVASRRDQRDEG